MSGLGRHSWPDLIFCHLRLREDETLNEHKTLFNPFPNVSSHLFDDTSATALSALIVLGSAATAGPIVPHGHYCLSHNLGGTDCSFTSYKQCLETALAYEAQC